MIQILLNKKQLQVTKELTDRDKALNLLILEHLMQNGLWYTASIMASEAEFLEPPPEIETVLTSNSGSFKRHTPARLEHSTLINVTRALDNPIFSSEMKTIEKTYMQSRKLSYLSACLNVDVNNEKSENSSRNPNHDEYCGSGICVRSKRVYNFFISFFKS